MIHSLLSASHVIEYHQDLSLDCESPDTIHWICEQLHRLSIEERIFTDRHLIQLNQTIKEIPTGRQRQLRSARDQVLYYLSTVCEWQLPPVKEAQFEDAQNTWMLTILQRSQPATVLMNGYQTQRSTFMTKRWADVGWLVMVLNMEVAPLPMRYWADVLSNPSSIEYFEGQFTLKVLHPKPIAAYDSKETPSFTRYALPLFAYRLLEDFYVRTPSARYTPRQLTHHLNQWGAQTPYYFDELQPAEWFRTFQCVWHGHHRLPAPFLRDFSDPMRHVATVSTVHTNIPKGAFISAELYQLPITELNETPSTSHGSRRFQWPHKALIKYHQGKHKTRPPTPPWQEHNLLPSLFYGFVNELFELGGIQRNTLQPDSIDRYTNFYQHLSPLSFACASDPETLHAWAHAQFTALQEQSTPWHLYNFLRYLAHQEITDHLDLSQFEKPTLPSLVDACCLSVTQIHDTVEALLSSAHGDALQRLFSAVALLLGYYGTLRRGEVLRLRMCDITTCPKDQQRFYLTITTTEEGAPKGGKTRTTAAYLPELSAKLVRALLAIKKNATAREPLIRVTGESLSQREQRYLYPVTQALKSLWGQHVRFHHLRHSGADLLYLQGLHLAYQRPPEHLACFQEETESQTMLTEATCQARFDFWLEGQPFCDVNDAILLDVMGKELGHFYYATTRKHYLHGMEKVGNIVQPKQRAYSRDELRYILGMSTRSNDISRVLNEIHPNYTLQSDEQKKRHLLQFSEGDLLPKVIARHQRLHNNTSSPIAPLPTWLPSTDKKRSDKAFISMWVSSLPLDYIDESHDDFILFNRHTLRLNEGSKFNFRTLSQQWLALKKLKRFAFDKKDRTQLKALGIPKVVKHWCEDGREDRPQERRPFISLIFCVKCNQKTQKAFSQLFHEGPFKAHPATLSLVQNRKSLRSTQHQRVESQFKRAKDSLQTFVVPEGDGALIIELHTDILAHHLIPPLIQHIERLFAPQLPQHQLREAQHG
ncbi:site-specific integrase [Vibrio cyclitrophicus]